MRVRFDVSRRDEFGELGGYLNEFTQSLQQTFRELIGSADSLALTASQNAQISEQTHPRRWTSRKTACIQLHRR